MQKKAKQPKKIGRTIRAGSRLTVGVPRGFSLPHAVCSYGYFLLAPNRWDPDGKALHRAFSFDDAPVVFAQITQPAARSLRIRCDRRVTVGQARQIRGRVVRMLRIDEDTSGWRRAHPVARRAKFDRLFRSATLFEDMVKTITGCNVSWPNTMRMNHLLCERVGGGGFPTALRLAKMREDTLKRWCKVGYRAKRIIDLAKRVVEGDLELSGFEDTKLSTDQLDGQLREIYGIGPYAAANLCQLLGRYDRVPIDTETYRHFRLHHRVAKSVGSAALDARIRRYYGRYAPYQFLAYWFELWQDYESRYGKATGWTSDGVGINFTASVLNQSA